MPLRRLIAVSTAAVAPAALPASASDPSEGTVSPSGGNCQQPYCDTATPTR